MNHVKMDLPSSESYCDITITTTLPPLTKQFMQLYFDKNSMQLHEGLQLYKARCLISVKAAFIGKHTFIQGLCKGSIQMLQYEVNLKLHESGTIEETYCECVAFNGVEGHCKHIAVILYGLEQMVRTKTMYKSQSSKNFKDTRPQTTRLRRKRKIEGVIFSPCHMRTDEDEYNQKFRSLILNYSTSTMPFKHLYEPANPYALVMDHSYGKIS